MIGILEDDATLVKDKVDNETRVPYTFSMYYLLVSIFDLVASNR